MSNHIERTAAVRPARAGRRRLVRCWPLLAVLLLGAPGLLPAQPPGQPAAGAPADDRAALRREVERRYEVLPIRDGVLLRPRAEKAGVRSIELAGDTIAVNGERLGAGVLRAWLAEEADLVLRLHELPPAERRGVFGLPSERAAAAEAVVPEPEEGELPAPPEAPAPPDTEDAEDLETPEAPDRHRVSSGGQVRLGGGVTVGPNESRKEVTVFGGPLRVDGEVRQNAVAIGGSVTVGPEGEVGGDVAAVAGSVTIDGRVDGEVSATGGSVFLGPGAEVSGDVVSTGGQVVRDPAAKVYGDVSEVPVFTGRSAERRRAFNVDVWPFSSVSKLLGTLIQTALSALLVCLVLLVAGRPHERVSLKVATDPWPSAGAGLLTILSLGPLLVLVTLFLVVSCIGIPLLVLYPVVFAALLAGCLLGLAAVSTVVGRLLEERFGRSFGGPYAVALAGVALIMLPEVLARLLGLGGGFLGPFAFAMLLLAWTVQFAALATGLGAVILTRFGVPRRTAALPPPPPPPVAPEPPPVAPPEAGLYPEA